MTTRFAGRGSFDQRGLMLHRTLRITGVELNPHLTAAEAIPLMAADFYSITATRVRYAFSIHETPGQISFMRRGLCSAVPLARHGARA